MIYKVILGTLAVTIVAIVVFKAIDPNMNGGNSGGISIIDKTTANKSTITIGISGEISRSGNYVLSEGATMSDLIEAAGGVNTSADERCYFFEATLKENETYYIPSKYSTSDACGNNVLDKVNINSADESSLLEISGVGSTIAKNIVNYRNDNGDFQTLEELKEVDGIGNATFSKMKNEIILKD